MILINSSIKFTFILFESIREISDSSKLTEIGEITFNIKTSETEADPVQKFLQIRTYFKKCTESVNALI